MNPRIRRPLINALMRAMQRPWLRMLRLAVLATWLGAGGSVGAATACPGAADIEPSMLTGRWQVEWADGARQRGEAPWTLILGPHPEYAGSLKGQLSRGSALHLVVADWDDETLTMEESVDGQRIAATWQATVTPGQCGQELRGLRFVGAEPDGNARRFRMRRLGPH